MLLVSGDMITTLSVTYIAPSWMTLESLLSLLNFDHLTIVGLALVSDDSVVPMHLTGCI
jgi:hypothetical protein